MHLGLGRVALLIVLALHLAESVFVVGELSGEECDFLQGLLRDDRLAVRLVGGVGERLAMRGPLGLGAVF